MDIEPEHIPQLPHFIPDDRPGDLPRISGETLIGVLDGHFNRLYEKLLVIDCRSLLQRLRAAGADCLSRHCDATALI